MDNFEKYDAVIIKGAFSIMALLVGGLSLYLLGLVLAPDPDDPLTKAGGLKVSQEHIK
jgi:hypothetical protein